MVFLRFENFLTQIVQLLKSIKKKSIMKFSLKWGGKKTKRPKPFSLSVGKWKILPKDKYCLVSKDSDWK